MFIDDTEAAKSRALLYRLVAPDWAKRGTWTPEQASWLLAGVDPKIAEHADEVERECARYFKDHAQSWPHLRADCPPADWLAWAEEMGFPVPPPLRDAVPARTEDPPPPPPPRRVSAGEATDDAVMAALARLGFDPMNLPPYRTGAHDGSPARRAVMADLNLSAWKMKAAWRRLKAAGRIRYAPNPGWKAG